MQIKHARVDGKMNYTKNEGATNATENIISKKRGRGGREGRDADNTCQRNCRAA